MGEKSMRILLLFSSFLRLCYALDTIKQGERLGASQTIVSSGGHFELGFFSPGQSKNFLYVGIWYKKISVYKRTVVWVTNRDYPISMSFNSSCYLSINKDGNLVISDGRGMSYSISSVSPSSHTSATLFDSGNFVLRNTISNEVLWQSFDHPADTFLPGMKFGMDKRTNMTWSLTSWNSLEDPSPGVFSTVLDTSSSEFLIMKGSQKFWTSGRWNGEIFSQVPNLRLNDIYNVSFVSNENVSYLTYDLHNTSMISRSVMDTSGKLKKYLWLDGTKEWALFWDLPRPCQVYALCGAFSSCNDMQIPNCRCLRGFEPYSLRDWMQQDWSAGCVRKSSLQCGGKDRFVLVNNLKFPVNFESFLDLNAEQCKQACSRNCSCTAYAYKGSCYLWMGDLLGIEQLERGDYLFLRVAASELQLTNLDSKNTTSSSKPRHKRQLLLTAALPVLLTILISGFFAFCLRKRNLKRKGGKVMSLDLLSFDFDTKMQAMNGELTDISKKVSGERWDAELPFFSLASISAATDNFKDANMLGQGGFGPVYKGKLLNGQEVAIKRLSRGSGQGLEEFKNEATLIAKLQHRNLVRLLGCCIEDEEKILIYEYMPNKSLDFFLFEVLLMFVTDPANQKVLDWEKRTHVIEGIAQGILYLHQHSRLRVIHRDLKASNILLDSKMNAKISDFGIARIFGGNELQANTNRVVGTYGYMSPEYVTRGLFSIKSDIFSFGVLLLEILSGKKNSSFHFSESLTLLGHAWYLWRNDKGHELIDPILCDPFNTSKALRYINVALLCVQEQAIDRPTMSDVVAMLSNEVTCLDSPKQPPFCTMNSIETVSSMNQSGDSSTNDVTLTVMEGR